MSSSTSWLDAMNSIGIRGLEALDPSLVNILKTEMESDKESRSVETLNKIRLIRADQKQARLYRQDEDKRRKHAEEELRRQHEELRSIKLKEWHNRLKEHDTKRAEERKRLLDLMRSEEEKRQRNDRTTPKAELVQNTGKRTIDLKVQPDHTVQSSPTIQAIQEYLTRRSDFSLNHRSQPRQETIQYIRRMENTIYARNTRLAASVYNVKL